jgi:hypothetical protein
MTTVNGGATPSANLQETSMMRHMCWGLLCALLLALGVPVEAQPPKKISHVGYLAAVSAAADAPRLEAFRQGLRELGYLEGQNVLIEYRHEAGGFERLPEHAAELVGHKPDVLVTVTTNAAQAAKKGVFGTFGDEDPGRGGKLRCGVYRCGVAKFRARFRCSSRVGSVLAAKRLSSGSLPCWASVRRPW